MFKYKKAALFTLIVVLGTPSVSMASSFTLSLVQGKTPAEAVQIIGEQVDLLTGRVATLETRQNDTELEIERLKLENENLRLKADEALTGTAETRANETRHKQCSELGAQISSKEDVVRAPFEIRKTPLEERLRQLATEMHAINADGSNSLNYPKPKTDVETLALLNRLKNGEEMGDFTQEERDKVYAYQTLDTGAMMTWLKEKKTQQDALRGQINSVDLEMEKALDTLHATVDFKTLEDKANSLLCA